ncbi:unnamed protein product [Prunus armeniaca]
MNDKVYSSIQWSYDRLESDEAKYGWGRGYFSNIDSVEEARNRVHSLVDKLQRRLLDITNCDRLEKIPHGLLSSLSSLEELYMENSFRKWEQSATESEDKRMASLVEEFFTAM